MSFVHLCLLRLPKSLFLSHALSVPSAYEFDVLDACSLRRFFQPDTSEHCGAESAIRAPLPFPLRVHL